MIYIHAKPLKDGQHGTQHQATQRWPALKCSSLSKYTFLGTN